MNEKLRFASIYTLGHTVVYMIAGAIVYPLLYKPFWEGPSPLLGLFMRLPSETQLWNQTMIWQIPGQLLRGLLMAIVLLPFIEVFKKSSIIKGAIYFAALYFVFAHFAATAPSGANIEGLLYMKPEFVKPFFLAGQPESILHGLLLGFIITKFGIKRN